jgi:putative heme-binding domain-containing protein
MRAYFSILALVAALPLAAQHGRYLNESRHPSIGKPEAIAAGAKLFSASCAGCHGPDGSGGARGPNLVQRALWHPLADEAIFDAIRKGIPGTDMPPTKLDDDQTWNLVAFIHALTGPASEQKVPGDATAGKQVYASSGCAGCHAIRGEGSLLGPDLSNIGGSRPLPVIREAILEPSKDLFYLGNEGVSVTMKDGRRLEGIARNRSNYSLQLVDKKGDLHLLRMNDVKEMTLHSTSPMPGDYGKRLSKEQLRDLLAYLAAQNIR